LKTELALTHRQAQNAKIILLEEPESHLSFSKLNQLISAIEKKYEGKQIIISTHSSLVANKLGLNNLLLLDNYKVTKITDLTSADFFKRISGYDTLRMLLCKKAILVEGDSDELVIQKAYMRQHNGKLPIEDQIDVISVGISFLRFLEIADSLHLSVAVVTDNDGSIDALERKYSNYLGANKKEYIKICYDKTIDSGDLRIRDTPYNYNTLEPKILKANGSNLVLFNELFGTVYTEIDELRKYMKHHKTECALAIFESDKDVEFPEYILEAIRNG
jgi:putative ATP-dependent endonuclease of OLD family